MAFPGRATNEYVLLDAESGLRVRLLQSPGPSSPAFPILGRPGFVRLCDGVRIMALEDVEVPVPGGEGPYGSSAMGEYCRPPPTVGVPERLG